MMRRLQEAASCAAGLMAAAAWREVIAIVVLFLAGLWSSSVGAQTSDEDAQRRPKCFRKGLVVYSFKWPNLTHAYNWKCGIVAI